MELWF